MAAAMEAPMEIPSETATINPEVSDPTREVRLNNLGNVAKALYDELGKLMLRVIHEEGFNSRERRTLRGINNVLVLCLRQSATGDVASKLSKSIMDGCNELEMMYPLKIIVNDRKPEPERTGTRVEPRANNTKHNNRNHTGGSKAKKRKPGN